MNEREFVAEIRNKVINANMRIYKRLFRATKLEEAADPYWQVALQLFMTLDEAQRGVFFNIIRQVEVDAVSGILRVLDEGALVEGEECEIDLLVGGASISGSLQDLFLEAEEEETLVDGTGEQRDG